MLGGSRRILHNTNRGREGGGGGLYNIQKVLVECLLKEEKIKSRFGGMCIISNILFKLP